MYSKGQIKPIADWRAVDFPPKMNNLVLFAFLHFMEKKQIWLFVLWENLQRAQTAFGFM